MVPSFRVHGLFRGVDHAPSASARNVYPVVKPDESGPPRSHPWLIARSGGVKGCGRRRDRRRRVFRQSFQLRPSCGLRVGTVNTQRLQWNLVLHVAKLKALLVTARRHSFDVLLVSDLHFQHFEEQVLYVEEFCGIARGAVGLLLKNRVAVEWEAAGTG